MATPALLEQVHRAFDEGRAEGGALRLVGVESGGHCGLDRDGRWVLIPDDGGAATAFDPERAYAFAIVLETPRRRFDDELEGAARRLGLPVDDVLVGFPTVEVIRGVLAKEHPYMTRLALEWAAVTELRELRREIIEVSRSKTMPIAVRELADRLTVGA